MIESAPSPGKVFRMKWLLVVVLLTVPALADTIDTFALQGENTIQTMVPLTTPTVFTAPHLTLAIGSQLVASGTAVMTLTIAGVTQTLTGNCSDACTEVLTFFLPSFDGVAPATLTLDYRNTSQVYSFLVLETPEPSSLALLGTGLLAVWRKVRVK